jgi:hypothetical protein
MFTAAHCRKMADDLERAAQMTTVAADRENLLNDARRWRDLEHPARVEERRTARSAG